MLPWSVFGLVDTARHRKNVHSFPVSRGKEGRNMDTEVIGKREAQKLRMQAKTVSHESDQKWFEQCQVLHRIYYSGYDDGEHEVQPLYVLWGYEDWYSYVEQELGIHVGTSRNMVATAHFFCVKMKGAWKGQILSPQLMKALARGTKVDKDNLNDLIERTIEEDLGPCALEAIVDGKQKPKKKNISWSIPAQSVDLVHERIDQLMETGEFATKGDALLFALGLTEKKKKNRRLRAV